MNKILTASLFVCATAALALVSLWQTPFFPQVHDQVQPERVYEMSQAILSGQYPPRFVPNLGYGFGYPLFNFYAPFPYYLGSLWHLVGFGLINATKLMVSIGFLLAGLSMFVAARTLWGNKGALVSSLLYLLAPYHAVQTYVRGSVGELYAYAFLPLIILGVLELYSPKIHKNKVFIGSFGLLLLSISHTVSLYMVIWLLALYLLISTACIYIQKKDLKQHLQRHMLFLGVPLAASAYFWLPAFAEISSTKLSLNTANDVRYADHFIELAQLWSSPWGFGGSAAGTTADGMSFMIGKLTLVAALITLLTALLKKTNLTKLHQKPILSSLTFLAMLSVFYMTSASNIVWEQVPYFQLIQFPWRFLQFVNLALALLAGGSIYWLQKIPANKRSIIFAASLFGICSYSLYSFSPASFLKPKYFVANSYYTKNESRLTSREHLRYEASKISDEFLPAGVAKPENPALVSQNQISCSRGCSISNSYFAADTYYIEVKVLEPTTIYVDKAYFPNFEVKVNGVKQSLDRSVTNKIGVSVPKGKQTVKFSLKNSPIRQAANAISLIAVVAFLGYHALKLQKGNISN